MNLLQLLMSFLGVKQKLTGIFTFSKYLTMNYILSYIPANVYQHIYIIKKEIFYYFTVYWKQCKVIRKPWTSIQLTIILGSASLVLKFHMDRMGRWVNGIE